MTQHTMAAFMPFFAAAAPAATDAPVQELRSRVDRTVRVLSDPAFKGPSKIADRRARVRKIAGEIFDYAEMSKRALGVHWQRLGQGERERFVRAFSDLLDRAYFEKIDSYTGETVRYLDPKIEGDRATVPTRVVTEKGTNIPVEYRMHRDQGRWMIHDVNIEGVSLVSNYRAQFDRIIRAGSVADLMKRHDPERPAEQPMEDES